VKLDANVSPPVESAILVLASYLALSLIGVRQTFGDEGAEGHRPPFRGAKQQPAALPSEDWDRLP
jgi:hypothetical protein